MIEEAVVEILARDSSSGAREIAVRLLEALYGAEDWREILGAAARVSAAHSEMSLLDNINWILREAAARGVPPAPLLGRIRKELAGEAALIAGRAARLFSERNIRKVLTLSWSSTVYEALRSSRNTVDEVYVMKSEPGGEGVVTARRLAHLGFKVNLIPDAASGHYAGLIDALLVGGDAVLSDGSLVNKAGTSVAACVMHSLGKPVYALVGLLKVDVRGAYRGVREFVEEGEEYRWRYVVFDVTPASHITGYITQRGLFGPESVVEVARSYVEELVGKG